jgi:hypothetical protein
MNKIDWREVILKIKKERKWPMKTIAGHVGVCIDTLYDWMGSSKREPRGAKRMELLRLAGMMDNPMENLMDEKTSPTGLHTGIAHSKQ